MRSPRSTGAPLADTEAMQSDIISALYATGDVEEAARLQRCQQARAARRTSSAIGWPWRCRSTARFSFCRRSSIRRWWFGLREWIIDIGGQVTVAALPVRGDGGLRKGVRHLRRACRDLRDRTARGPGGRSKCRFIESTIIGKLGGLVERR